jgi:hypothetical protein
MKSLINLLLKESFDKKFSENLLINERKEALNKFIAQKEKDDKIKAKQYVRQVIVGQQGIYISSAN